MRVVLFFFSGLGGRLGRSGVVFKKMAGNPSFKVAAPRD